VGRPPSLGPIAHSLIIIPTILMHADEFALVLEKIEKEGVDRDRVNALLAGCELNEQQKEHLRYFICPSCGGKKWSPGRVQVAASLR
jgi:hypothetical protein